VLVFFLVLVVLAVVAAAVPVIVNLRQQLRPEQLDEARRSWQEHGPADYNLEYTVLRDRDPTPERYFVMVRGRRVVFVLGDGQVLHLDRSLGEAMGLPALALAGEGAGHGIEAIFARMDELLREDEQSGRRNYAMAIFDPKDGHPRRFVHRVRGTDTREEWNILLRPAP
jgi:hypothetical protein